jgi:hypothetical protein
MTESNSVSTLGKREFALAIFLQSISKTVRYLFGKKWLILAIALLGGIAGITIAWLQKPKYQSDLSFALEDNGGGLSGALSIAAEFGFNLGGAGKNIFGGDNILEITTSRKIIERVLLGADTISNNSRSLADYYMEISGMKKSLTKHPRLGTISFPTGADRTKFNYFQDSILFSIYRNIIKSDLRVSRPDKKLNIFRVNFTSYDERFTKIFTDRLERETTEYYTELRTKRSKATLEILENRVAQIKGSVGEAISSKATTQDANLNPVFAASQAPLQKRQVDITAYGAAYAELFKNLEIARYQYLNDVPLLQVIDEANYPMKKLKMGRLRSGILGAMLSGIIACIMLLVNRQLRRLLAVPAPNSQ